MAVPHSDAAGPRDAGDATAVRIDEVTHDYGLQRALRAVSFEVPAGSLFGLLGPNGSGKTTLFRIITTLLRPTKGSVRVFGADTTQSAHRVRAQIGMIFQHTALDQDLTVRENVELHGALFGLDADEIDARLDALLDQLGLSDRRDDRVRTLSGGLRRRADLARGLIHEPRVLLLDEPTSGLDPIARRELWDHLKRLRANRSTTILLATHLMEEAERCDRVAIISEGRLATSGPPDRLKRELGRETLWLESDDPSDLHDRIEAQFGFDVRIIGDAVQVTHSEAHSVLSAIYEALEDDIRSATVREPTLEDVFMVSTGHPIDEDSVGAVSSAPDG